MHPTELPAKIIEETIERRGVLHPLADIEPATTALLVVDMQNFFIDMVPGARTIVPNINRLAGELRDNGGKVIWIAMTVDPEDRQRWSHFYSKLLSKEGSNAHFTQLKRGCEEWQIWPELKQEQDDWHIEKSRFSAFIQGSSDLEQRLRRAGITTLLITGTVTNVCCESTARDAMMLDFETVMISDGCAALDDDAHLATLANFQTVFGDVLSVDEVLASTDRTVRLRRA